MQELRFIITTLSPIIITSNTGDPNMVNTCSYIPSRVIRGLFAGKYIDKFPLKDAHRDERFYNWFLRGAIRFTDACILFERDNNQLWETYPVPLSIQKQKYGETIFDLCFTESEDQIDQTTPVEGYCFIQEDLIYQAQVNKSLNFHHARDRQKGVSKEGQIFNYESIDPHQSFGGYIIAKEQDIKEFQELFHDGIYYIGRSRNNQYGRVKIKFNADFKKTSEVNEALEHGEITLTFLSDTIIYNEWGYSVVDVKRLEEILQCHIKRSFIRATDNEGFVSVWRLRTPSEVSFKAGSCFLLDVKDEETLHRLLELQKTGIGEKTEDGYGRFALGIQTEEKLITKGEDVSMPSVPQEPVPDMVKDILQKAFRAYAERIIRKEAIEKALTIKDNPRALHSLTTSLLGRLILMLRDDFDNFKSNLQELGNLPKKRLENIPFGKTSLYEFLLEFRIDRAAEHPLNTLKNKRILKDLPQNPIEDEGFKKRLSYIYLETLFTMLLKIVKTAGGYKR